MTENNTPANRTGKRPPRRGPKRVRTIGTNVGKVYLEADLEKRKRAADAMRKIAGA